MKSIVLILSAVFCVLQGHAFQLRGKITDPKGKPVPGVSVYVEGSTYGVVSNPVGEYIMELDAGNYEIVFRQIGFEETKKNVSITQNLVLNVQLKDDYTELASVVIMPDAEDPAYAMIRAAQKKKKDYLKQFTTAKCEAYSKITLQIEKKLKIEDSLIQFSVAVGDDNNQDDLIECYSRVYFKSPSTIKEEKYAYLDHSNVGKRLNFGRTANISHTFGQPEKYDAPQWQQNGGSFVAYKNLADIDFNFYNNLVSIPALSDKPFISPIAKNALLSYRYRWIESFAEDGEIIHKIEVIPRRERASLFSGILYLVDQKWAIKALELEASQSVVSIYDEFKIFQNYADWNNHWVVTREELFYNTSTKQDHKIGHTVVMYSDWEFDPELEQKFFNNAVTTYTPNAMDVSPEFWANNRPITMNETEQLYIEKRDSTRDHLKSPEYLNKADSSFNHTGIWDWLILGVGKRNTAKGYTWRLNPLISQPRPLAVGGYRHAIGGGYDKEFETGKAMDLDLQLDYGFLNNDLRGNGRLGYRYNPMKMARAWVRLGSEYEILNTFESIVATFSRSNYVLTNHITLGHEFEIVNGIFLDLSLRYSHQKSIEDLMLSNWSGALWGKAGLNDPQPFDDYSKLMFDNLISIRFNQKYEITPTRKIIKESKLPKLNIRHKWGIPNILGSEVAFHSLQVKLWDYVGFGTAGYSKYNITVGSFFNAKDTRFVDNIFIRGSDRYFLSDPLKSLQLLERTINTQGPYLQANYVHHFNGALMNKIPLIKRTRLMSAGGAATLLDTGNDLVHTEAFVGIEWPFRLGDQLFKLGGYYVQSWSNASGSDYTIKFGIDFFNSYTGKWTY